MMKYSMVLLVLVLFGFFFKLNTPSCRKIIGTIPTKYCRQQFDGNLPTKFPTNDNYRDPNSIKILIVRKQSETGASDKLMINMTVG